LPSKAARSRRKPQGLVAKWVLGIPAIVFGVLVYGYVTLPDVRPLANANPPTTAFMELRAEEAKSHGKPVRKIQRWISYKRISPDLKRAVLVAEDAAFWDHDGVDYDELQKSIELDWARGQLVRGGSTITQQLAKNLYLSPSRNPARKLRELVITRRLEAELQKARILELYLNLIEWGDGIYGVEAASRAYFGQSASTLGPSSSALLAGAIINPRVLNPTRPTPRLLRRQQMILKRMGGVTPPVETAPPRPPDSPPQPVVPPDATPAELPGILPTAPPEPPAESSVESK
jgi:monofunctional glycosyltransferase